MEDASVFRCLETSCTAATAASLPAASSQTPLPKLERSCAVPHLESELSQTKTLDLAMSRKCVQKWIDIRALATRQTGQANRSLATAAAPHGFHGDPEAKNTNLSKGMNGMECER